ncbi:MAG: hypothetical protein GY868_17215, partial [Deltaproteobacteria bacterium]|nr:hypothetical protein [Deltaproteobacteria bacterium]
MPEKAVQFMLDPAAMRSLRIERDSVKAGEVFGDVRVGRQLCDHGKLLRRYEQSGSVPESIAAINALTVPDGDVPEAISHQDVSGRQVRQQARLITRARFRNAVR